MEDEPLFSPYRIWIAIRMYVWYIGSESIHIPFWQMIRYHRRPRASDRDGVY